MTHEALALKAPLDWKGPYIVASLPPPCVERSVWNVVTLKADKDIPPKEDAEVSLRKSCSTITHQAWSLFQASEE